MASLVPCERSVARGRRALPETALDLLALTGKVGFEFGTAVPNGWGTGLARECLAEVYKLSNRTSNRVGNVF